MVKPTISTDTPNQPQSQTWEQLERHGSQRGRISYTESRDYSDYNEIETVPGQLMEKRK